MRRRSTSAASQPAAGAAGSRARVLEGLGTILLRQHHQHLADGLPDAHPPSPPQASDPGDIAAELALSEHLEAEESVRRSSADSLRLAVGRVLDGTYGVCRDCGRDISTERLVAIPTTAVCRQCAR